MTNTTDIGDADDDEDLYDDEIEFIGNTSWEDNPAYLAIVAKMPPGWYLVKVNNYTANTLMDIADWCDANCMGTWERVRWSIGCSYSTAVQFEQFIDATLFKLRWS